MALEKDRNLRYQSATDLKTDGSDFDHLFEDGETFAIGTLQGTLVEAVEGLEARALLGDLPALAGALEAGLEEAQQLRLVDELQPADLERRLHLERRVRVVRLRHKPAAKRRWGYWAMLRTPIDAIPDLSENQVIVFAVTVFLRWTCAAPATARAAPGTAWRRCPCRWCARRA